MSLFKRSTSPNWYYKLYPPGGGKPIQGSTGTDDKSKAQEYHDRLKTNLWDQARLGRKPEYTWNEAVVRYVGDRIDLASLETTKTHLRWLDQHLDGWLLSKIDRDKVDAIARAKRAEPRMVRTLQGPKPLGRTVSASTVNRVMGVLTAVLNVAIDWGWIDRAPVGRRMKVVGKRIRWLTPAEAAALLRALPTHLADMAQFSLETGLRRANVTGLEWTQVDLSRRTAWIHADQAKARRPINRAAVGHRRRCPAPAGREEAASRVRPQRLRLSRSPGPPDDHRRLAGRAGESRYPGLPLARSAAHVGELAHPAGHTDSGVEGTGRMGDDGDGAALRAPVGRSPGAVGAAAYGAVGSVIAAI